MQDETNVLKENNMFPLKVLISQTEEGIHVCLKDMATNRRHPNENVPHAVLPWPDPSHNKVCDSRDRTILLKFEPTTDKNTVFCVRFDPLYALNRLVYLYGVWYPQQQ